MVIEPNVRDGRTEFDLTAARRARRREQKRLYVYLGANDCRTAASTKTFLRQNNARSCAEFRA